MSSSPASTPASTPASLLSAAARAWRATAGDEVPRDIVDIEDTLVDAPPGIRNLIIDAIAQVGFATFAAATARPDAPDMP